MPIKLSIDIITSNSTLSVGTVQTSNGGSFTAEVGLPREVRLPLAEDTFLDMDITLSFIASLLAEVVIESTGFVDSIGITGMVGIDLTLFK